MGKIITFFNHKGGVGKTTLVHNLAFALSDLGKRVLLLDADPQMNLTASMYGLATSTEYSLDDTSIWKKNTQRYLSIKEFIQAETGSGSNNTTTTKQVFRKQNKGGKGYIDLITGDIALSKIEFDLFGILKNLNDFSKNIPGKIQKAIDEKATGYDFVLIDTSPSSSSSINALLVLTSHYLISPVSPTFFSLQAIDNLSFIFQSWTKLFEYFIETMGNPYGIDIRVKFLGLVVQMAKRFSGGGKNPSDFSQKTEEWVKDLNNSASKFVQYMIQTQKAISEKDFKQYFKDIPEASPYIIEKCCDFTPKLRTTAEKEGVPVIHLNEEMTKKHHCSIATPNGQYTKSFNSINDSYRNIAKALLNV